jgi:hypothetical protein
MQGRQSQCLPWFPAPRVPQLQPAWPWQHGVSRRAPLRSMYARTYPRVWINITQNVTSQDVRLK